MEMRNNHMIWMMLGCAIPIIIIALLPFFGYKGNYIVFIGIALMITIHIGVMFFMKHNHCERNKDHHKEQKHQNNNEEDQ